MNGGDRLAGAALRHNVARASFAPPALGRHAQLELDVIEAHPGTRLAGDFSIGDTAADADDHAGNFGGVAVELSV